MKTVPMNLQLFAEGDPAAAAPIVPPTAPAQPVTPTAAVTVDMEAINKAAEARAERAAQTVVKDMLKQSGLDDVAIKGVLDDWKAKQTTPEQEIKKRDDTIGALTQQLESEKQEKIALSKGIPIGSTDAAVTDKVTACLTLAKSYVTADVTFEAALDRALKIISFEGDKPIHRPPMWGGSGSATVKPAMSAEKQAAIDAARSSMKIK